MRKLPVIAFRFAFILLFLSPVFLSAEAMVEDTNDLAIDRELNKLTIYIDKPGGESGLKDYVVVKKRSYHLSLERDSFFIIQDLENMINLPDEDLSTYKKKLIRLAKFSNNLIVRRYASNILRINKSLVKYPSSHWFFLSLLKGDDSYNRQEALLFFMDYPFPPAFPVLKKQYLSLEQILKKETLKYNNGVLANPNSKTKNISSLSHKKKSRFYDAKGREMLLSLFVLSRLKKGKLFVHQIITKQFLELKKKQQEINFAIPKSKNNLKQHETIFQLLLPLKNKWLRKAKRWSEKGRLKFYHSIIDKQFSKYFVLKTKNKNPSNSKKKFVTHFFVRKKFIENLKKDVKEKGWGFWKKNCFSCDYKNTISKDEGKESYYIGRYLWQNN